MATLYFSGSTHHERHALTSMVSEALSAAGSVLEHTQFSNIALAIHFELIPNRASTLAAAMKKIPLALTQDTVRRLSELVAAEEQAPDLAEPPLDCWFHLIFIHNEPDLKVTVPAVPG